MERIRRNKKRNYTIFIVLAALVLTVGYATFAQPLAHRLATIMPEGSRFGIWKSIINDNKDDNGNNNIASNTNNTRKRGINGNYSNENNANNGGSGNSGGISNKQWDIGFVDAARVSSFGEVTENSPVIFNKLFATFDVLFNESGASITYSFDVKNKGELDAKLEGYDITTTNDSNFKFEVGGIDEGDVLEVGKKQKMTIKITYIGDLDSATAGDSGKITVVLRYVQK
ncbi:MAG: hypothetical protein IKG40_02900 [Bacilli bacterium]|nr:hypothetical protein [Bacilli bacterium]